MAAIELSGDGTGDVRTRAVPITLGFSGFSALGFAALLAALSELAGGMPLLHGAGHNLGFVAATVLVVAGLALLLRSQANLALRLTGFFLGGPAAVWAIFSVALDFGVPLVLQVVLVLSSITGSVVLLGQGLAGEHWVRSFVGLGLLGLTASMAVVMAVPPDTHVPFFLSLTLVISSSACLYGALVDVELEATRSARALEHVHHQLELTERETRDLLHDLRSGLLSVEAASILAFGDGSGLLQAEIARLRLLTARNEDHPIAFDLVAPLRGMSDVRRSTGTEIDLRAPEQATVTGCPSQVMSILQNLIDNAQRHGEGGIRVSVEERDGALAVAVADEGTAVTEAAVERFFERGCTTHPEGSGIGLDAARRLARANNAELSFERTAQGTTSFVLSFDPSGTAMRA